jgi:hypothetical protein
VNRRGDRLARLTVLLTGLVLVLGGGAALSRGLGVFDRWVGAGAADRSASVLVTDDVSRWFSEHGGVVWPVAAAVALLLAFLGYRLLRGQLWPAVPRSRVIDLSDDPAVGTTRVPSSLATSAFTADLAGIAGVEGAATTMRGDPARPVVDVRLDVAEDADVTAVLTELESGALARLRSSLELQPQATTVEVRLTEVKDRRLG